MTPTPLGRGSGPLVRGSPPPRGLALNTRCLGLSCARLPLRPPGTAGRRQDVRSACHLYAPHPARRDRNEPRTSPCRSRAVTTPRLPRLAARGAPGMPPVCAASGASRLRRAAHVTVPLARRDRTPTCHSLLRWLRRAGHLCALRQRATITASQARFYAACATQPPPVGHSRRQDMRRACHLCVPHHARRDRSKQSTSPCRSRNVSPSPPATAGSVRVVRLADHFCVQHRRVAIAASRARPRAARATGPSARGPPAMAGGGLCTGCATCVCFIRRVTIAASLARPRAALAM